MAFGVMAEPNIRNDTILLDIQNNTDYALAVSPCKFSSGSNSWEPFNPRDNTDEVFEVVETGAITFVWNTNLGGSKDSFVMMPQNGKKITLRCSKFINYKFYVCSLDTTDPT